MTGVYVPRDGAQASFQAIGFTPEGTFFVCVDACRSRGTYRVEGNGAELVLEQENAVSRYRLRVTRGASGIAPRVVDDAVTSAPEPLVAGQIDVECLVAPCVLDVPPLVLASNDLHVPAVAPPFTYRTAKDAVSVVLSNFSERLIAPLMAEAGKAILRIDLPGGRKHLLSGDHYNNTGGAVTMGMFLRNDRSEPVDVAIAGRPRADSGLEGSEDWFDDMMNGVSPGKVHLETGEVRYVALGDVAPNRTIILGRSIDVPAGGAIQLTLVASRGGAPDPATLVYDGRVFKKGMPPEWESQHMGINEAGVVEADLPLRVDCSPDITWGSSGTVVNPGGPFWWKTHIVAPLGGSLAPAFNTSAKAQGFINLKDMQDMLTPKADPAYRELHRFGAYAPYTTLEGVERYAPNLGNFGVIYRHALRVSNACDKPRTMVVRALVRYDSNWFSSPPADGYASMGIAYRVGQGAWRATRIGRKSKNGVTYTPENEKGSLTFARLTVPAGGEAALTYEQILTPPSKGGVLQAITVE